MVVTGKKSHEAISSPLKDTIPSKMCKVRQRY